MTAQRQLRPTLDELAQPCARCGHQNAGHTGGAARSGWPVFDPTWADALGWCTVLGCTCPGRTSDPAAGAGAERETPPVITAPPPRVTRLTGPCGYGDGPCGRTPTRPYAQGPLCVEHAPGGAR